MIYVNGEAQQRILSNFHFSLNPSGCLMLGPSESLGGLQSAFSPIDRRWKLYRKRRGGKASTGKVIAPAFENLPSRVSSGITIIRPGTEPNVPRGLAAPDQKSNTVSTATMDYFARYLSERYAPATLFVNQQYDILYLIGDFNGILQLPRFNAMLSLHAMVSEEAESLLTAGVDRVLRTGTSGGFERINVAKPGDPAALRAGTF